MNIASGHFLLLAAALALACAPMPTALTDTLTTTESSETTDGVETGSTGAETSGATAVTTASTDTGEGSTAVTSDATTSEETETEETALTTDATTIEPTTDDPTTIGPTTDDPTDETSDGAGDLEIFVDLTSANILCNDAPESPFEASWVVSLDNSQGLAPVTVALESAYLSFTWTFERVSASYVTVAPDGSVGVGAGEVVDYPAMALDTLDVSGDPCEYCGQGPPIAAQVFLTFLVDGAPVEVNDSLAGIQDMSPLCL